MYRIIYSLNNQVACFVDENGNNIPPDEANPDYQRYLAWVAEGNTPEPWEPSTTPEP